MTEENKKSPSGIKLFGATITVDEATVVRENLKKFEDPSSPEKMKSRPPPPPPDEMIPCPRCKSTETKFCYFNNYNVNQPRHFCKGCQRYWTAGGALRNVPVGAGRRKAKPPGREGCLFDAAAGGTHELLDFDALLEEWRAAAAASEDHVGLRQFLPGKRRRFAAASN